LPLLIEATIVLSLVEASVTVKPTVVTSGLVDDVSANVVDSIEVDDVIVEGNVVVGIGVADVDVIDVVVCVVVVAGVGGTVGHPDIEDLHSHGPHPLKQLPVK
jgi:hypothetical protein